MPANRFVQILSSESSLTALDTEGDVHVYLGQRFGWAKLNMTRLSDADALKVRQIKFGKDEPIDDDPNYGQYPAPGGYAGRRSG